jgi:hypothetical protein
MRNENGPYRDLLMRWVERGGAAQKTAEVPAKKFAKSANALPPHNSFF